jgi:hypothetical protein
VQLSLEFLGEKASKLASEIGATDNGMHIRVGAYRMHPGHAQLTVDERRETSAPRTGYTDLLEFAEILRIPCDSRLRLRPCVEIFEPAPD